LAMRSSKRLVACAAAFTLLGCATASRPSVIDDEAPNPYWSGSLQPTQQRSGALVVTGQNRVFGSVRLWAKRSGNLDRMHVTLTVAVPTASATSLRWAVLPERCGSGDLPLIGFEQFPLIEVSTNGRGQVEADLPLVLAPNSVYHVNVYSGGQQLENVLTCANLKYEIPSR
ncbi:MAG TPA: hypothetical protein VFN38_12110, partial [Gemmatimonadaceae bacterium]|nr:hypothetical protein [Gemmatimonadaceae bacterium]